MGGSVPAPKTVPEGRKANESNERAESARHGTAAEHPLPEGAAGRPEGAVERPEGADRPAKMPAGHGGWLERGALRFDEEAAIVKLCSDTAGAMEKSA